jgi:acetolactate synthase-1/2/3 large subunit
VLVDIAKDAMQAMTTFSYPARCRWPATGRRPSRTPSRSGRRRDSSLAAQRPVLYVGGGVVKARAWKELRILADLLGMPVVTTLMARGAFPDSHDLHRGMPGMHGSVAAVLSLQRSDLIISLGARFDDRVTGRPRLLRARRQGHPRRHRPGGDLQEPDRRRADRGRRARGHLRADRRLKAEHDAGRGGDYTAWRDYTAGIKRRYPLGYELP